MIRALSTFAAVAALALSLTASARSLSPIQYKVFADGVDRMLLVSGRVQSVTHAVVKCGPPQPGAELCANLTTVKIAFGLGCLDDLAVSSVSTFNRAKNRIVIDVTALHLANVKSQTAKCIRQNVKVATISVKTDLQHVDAKDVEVNYQTKFADVR
jgi:hypothetical protein